MSKKIVTEFTNASNEVDPRIIKLLTKKYYQKLVQNGKNPGVDHTPVVKLFTPDGSGTWLLSGISDGHYAFGLCDLGLGYPELGKVDLLELMEAKGVLGLPVERDRYITLEFPLSVYYKASFGGYIVTTPSIVRNFA